MKLVVEVGRSGVELRSLEAEAEVRGGNVSEPRNTSGRRAS